MLNIIVAIAQGGVIGDKNSLLWHIREDMLYFKRLTTSHPVIMGRKTYESIGRPLPNRTNIVISRQHALHIEGCTVVGSLEEAVAMFPADEELYIIGGAQIYAAALPLADRLYITRIDHRYSGDTSFPDIDAAQWTLQSSEYHPCGEQYEYPFAFEVYTRR